ARMLLRVLCVFFQAEDGIRDDLVTGVQTCALPISWMSVPEPSVRLARAPPALACGAQEITRVATSTLQSRRCAVGPGASPGPWRSEERRVGKEGREGGSVEE